MNEQNEPFKTPLYEQHLEAKAKVIEFGGWLMPVQYTGIVAEHRKVREGAAIFDLSHMGRVQIAGPAAARFLQFLTTNDLSKLAIGRAQYSLLCNRAGGVRDDILVYRLADSEYLLVVNASNRIKVLGWIEDIKASSFKDAGASDFTVDDRTLETVMVGIQGPQSESVLRSLTDIELKQLRYYHVSQANVIGEKGLVSRTGYTGEDGFEVILPVDAGIRLWRELSKRVATGEVALAGLGARDTLRMEAGMPLYGHELDETINPLEVGLSRFVRMDKGAFVGRDALLLVAQNGPKRRLLGLEMPDRAIARQGTQVMAAASRVGQVTSGSFSPTLERSVAMALVDADKADGHLPLEVIVRGTAHPANIVSLPFYSRKR